MKLKAIMRIIKKKMNKVNAIKIMKINIVECKNNILHEKHNFPHFPKKKIPQSDLQQIML